MTEKDTIKINFKKKSGDGTFRVIEFKDNDYYVTYIPTLNLTGYGDTSKEALELLGEALKDYMQNLVKKPESFVNSELSKMGWTRSTFFKKKFENASYIDEKGILQNFNLPMNTPIHKKQIAV